MSLLVRAALELAATVAVMALEAASLAMVTCSSTKRDLVPTGARELMREPNIASEILASIAALRANSSIATNQLYGTVTSAGMVTLPREESL